MWPKWPNILYERRGSKMRISDEAAHKFISLYTLLMYYAGQERKVLPHAMSLDDFKEVPLGLKTLCREAIYEPTPLLKKFVDANRELLTKEALDTLDSWTRGYVRGTFMVVRHLRKYNIFYVGGRSPKVFAVLGLTGELSRLIPKEIMPVMVKTVLMPYEGVIVCDGLLLADGHVMPELESQQEMMEEYNAAKQSLPLITTLG